MSKWSFNVMTMTPAASADNALLAGGWMALGGGSATQYIKVQEIQEVGQAVATSANIMQFARDSTAGATPTALTANSGNSMGPLDASTAVLAAPNTAFIAATTAPTRSGSITAAKLNMSFNAFGGILRWQAAPDEEWGIITATGPAGESSLSGFTGTGTGAMGAHIIFEVK
jgi:hypothetical protein